MRATAAPVEGNRVRLSVEIDAAEVDQATQETFRRLSREVRVPGFRPGKAPRQVIEARLGGAGALRQQAIRDLLPDLYAQAVVDTEVDPISPPDIDITSKATDDVLTFDALVEVRPTVAIPGYTGLVVTVPSVTVEDDEVDTQIDRLREQSGELVEVGRPARDGDHVTIDVHGSRSGDDEDVQVDDVLYEVGSGSDVPGLDDQLRGAKPGDILQFSNSEDAEPATYRVLVKDVKEKILPEPTDAWAAEASEFETVEALRADLRHRLQQVKVLQAQFALRDGALQSLVELVEDDPPEALIEEELRERVRDLGHRLKHRNLDFASFLRASGQDEETLLVDLREGAVRSVRADLALRALADAEDLQVSDDELDDALQEMAAQVGADVDTLRDQMDRNGRLSAVRSDQRKAKALTWLLDHVELVDEHGAAVDRQALRIDQGDTAPVGEPDADASVGGAHEDTEQERTMEVST